MISAARVLGLLVVCLAAQFTIAILIVPPWQNPDEPQHVMAARLILAHGPNFSFPRHRDDPAERAIVASMARHDWWRHYGQVTPDPVPTTFADGPAHIVKDAFTPPGGSRVYYRGVAAVFWLTGIDSVVSQMYAMRVLSIVLSVIAVVCVWAATRLWLDAQSAIGIALVMGLHPQFVLVSTTASPDAAANLAGAVVWLNGVALLQRPPAFRYFALLWSAALLGFLTRRMAAPLVAGALVVTLAVFIRQLRSGALAPGGRRFIYAFAAILVAVATAWWAAPDDIDVRTMSWRSATVADVLAGVQAVRFDPELAARTIVSRLPELPRFAAGLFGSFWLSAGWLRYPAAPWWYIVLALVTIAAGIGVLRPRLGSERRAVLLTAGGFVLLQLSVVVVYYFGIMRAGSQGRYLFPVLPALLSLVWVGWCNLFPLAYQRMAALILIGLLLALNVAAWTGVLLPAFA